MTKTMKIEGMMCMHCEARVKKTLEALPEVAEAVVSHEAGTAVLTLSADISNEALTAVIEEDGYKVVKVFEAGDDTQFIFEGLDAGEYKISETAVPSGYNKAADIIFEVVAEYDTTKEPVKITGLSVQDASGKTISSVDGKDTVFKVTLDEDKSDLSTIVINKPGVTLPSTGGMGTTVFYAVGGILVVAAAVLLITKKRMSAEK